MSEISRKQTPKMVFFSHIWSCCDPDLLTHNLINSSLTRVALLTKVRWKSISAHHRYRGNNIWTDARTHARTTWKHNASGTAIRVWRHSKIFLDRHYELHSRLVNNELEHKVSQTVLFLIQKHLWSAFSFRSSFYSVWEYFLVLIQFSFAKSF